MYTDRKLFTLSLRGLHSDIGCDSSPVDLTGNVHTVIEKFQVLRWDWEPGDSPDPQGRRAEPNVTITRPHTLTIHNFMFYFIFYHA